MGMITGPDVPVAASSRPSSAVLQKDAFLVFRALCKLSIKTADGGQGADPMALRGKVGHLLGSPGSSPGGVIYLLAIQSRLKRNKNLKPEIHTKIYQK